LKLKFDFYFLFIGYANPTENLTASSRGRVQKAAAASNVLINEASDKESRAAFIEAKYKAKAFAAKHTTVRIVLFFSIVICSSYTCICICVCLFL